MSNYVISDLHGHFALYNMLLKTINFSNKDTLYVLGDAIDRGPDGIKILQDIMKRDNVVFLPGNHEDMMCMVIRSIYDDLPQREILCERWWLNGGEVTARELYKLEDSEIIKIEKFIRNSPLEVKVEINNKVFVMAHATPLNMTKKEYEEKCNSFSKVDNINIEEIPTYKKMLLWKRVEKDHIYPKDIIAIFGHTPTSYYQNCRPYKIWEYENKICLDCSLANYHLKNKNSRLGCLCLDDLSKIYITREMLERY